MGYYSDVALALKGRSLKQFKSKLAATTEKTRKDIMVLFDNPDKYLTEDDSECWFWKDVKWYTNWPEYYPDVDFVDKFLEEAEDEEFYFVRTGEEYDDNEIRGYWWDNPFGITLCREIMLDY